MLECLLFLMCLGEPIDFLSTKELFLEHQSFNARGRIAELSHYKPRTSTAIGMNLTILGPVYWKNYIHGHSTSAQFRLVGWKSELGVRLFNIVELAYHHHSQHILDDKHKHMKFPVEDSFVVRVYFVR